MQFTISRKALLGAVQRCQGIAESKSTVPVLSHALMREYDGNLFIQATDLEVGIETVCALATDGDGREERLTLSAKKLCEVLKASDADQVVIKRLDNDRIEIAAGRAKFKMVSLDPRSFPSMPTESTDKGKDRPQGTLILDAAILAQMIDGTLFAVSPDEARYNLSGVYVEAPKPGAVRMVATDGHRLAKIEREASIEGFSSGVILPRKGLQEARKLLDGIDGRVTVRIDGTAALRVGDTALSMRLVEGEFPDYTGIIPEDSTIKARYVLPAAELDGMIKRAMLFSNERFSGAKLAFADGKLTVSSNSAETGEATDTLEVSASGPAIEIGFNGNYLRDVLRLIPADKTITLSLIDGESPGIITTESDLDFKYIVMPMRI